MKTLFSSLQPIGKIEHFSGRPEFFETGNPHAHMLFWTAHQIIYNGANDKQFNDFVDKYCCISMLSEGNNKLRTVDKILLKGQWHIDTFTCKQFKTHTGRKRETSCCFYHPRMPMRETQILQPLTFNPQSDVSIAVYKKAKKNLLHINT